MNETFTGKLRASIIRGALFVAPLWLSITLAGVVYNLIESALGGVSSQLVRWLVPAEWLAGRFESGYIPGLSLIVTFVLLLLVGSVASWQLGRMGMKLFDRLFLALPFVRAIYASARKLIDSFGEPGQARFKKVVMIDLNGRGMKMPGLVTSELPAHGDRPASYAVFVPFMPNPTSGFVLLLERSKVEETEISPEEALKFGLSLGVLAPPSWHGTSSAAHEDSCVQNGGNLS